MVIHASLKKTVKLKNGFCNYTNPCIWCINIVVDIATMYM